MAARRGSANTASTTGSSSPGVGVAEYGVEAEAGGGHRVGDGLGVVGMNSAACSSAASASSDAERASGYGLPEAEYRKLYERRSEMEPLPASKFWIGRYEGVGRTASMWVTPLVVNVEGYPEPEWPQGYVMTIVLGELLLHGIRFTTPFLEFGLSTQRALPSL
jgi:hypothetical protein